MYAINVGRMHDKFFHISQNRKEKHMAHIDLSRKKARHCEAEQKYFSRGKCNQFKSALLLQFNILCCQILLLQFLEIYIFHFTLLLRS